MVEFHRIAVSEWESDDKRVAVVEILDERLYAPGQLQDLARELTSLLEDGERKDVLLDLARVDYISSAALNPVSTMHAQRLRTRKRSTRACMTEKTSSAEPSQPIRSSRDMGGRLRETAAMPVGRLTQGAGTHRATWSAASH